LQQFLEVWSVQRKTPYDVFEVPPVLTASEKENLETQLKNYTNIVSTLPWKGAWIIDDNQIGNTVDQSEAKEWQQKLEKEIDKREW
jgi:hypothetical protein